MATLLKDGRGVLGTTMTMTTTTGPTGGRENADDFARYVDEDDDDRGRGGAVAPERQRGRRMERKRRKRMMTRGWRAVTMTVGRARTARGGQSTTPFLGLRWHGTTAGQRQHQQRHTTIK